MLRLESVARSHGSQILFFDASLALYAGDRVGLVGPNGAGKSTIFRILTGEEQPDEGTVSIDRGTRVGYFSQSVGEMSGRTVLAETLAGAGEVSTLGAELAELEAAMADPDRMDELDRLVERYGVVQARFEELGGYGLEARALEILAGLGFRDAVVRDDVGKLSGGWKMRVALARILLMQPDALLLDEPTNHLDLESILWLEAWLRAFPGALLITSHDREFLNRLVTKIVEIDAGTLTTFTGNYDWYEQQRELIATQLAAQVARQEAMLAKERAFIERFKARAIHAAQVQSRVKKLEKIDTIEPPRRRYVPTFDFATPPRSGNDVVRIEGVRKAYGDHVIYDGFDFLVRRLERWAVLGVNGAGKSTLLRMVAGASAPDAGSVTIGANVTVGYFSQHAMDVLDGDQTVIGSLQALFPTSSLGVLRNLAGAFGFPGDDVEKRVKLLSGGERARLVMARLLFQPPNLLVLDEPTNHLDLATKQMLVGALAGYEGTMLFVSHDRAFLGAVANRMLELTPAGPVPFEGGYREFVAARGYEAPRA